MKSELIRETREQMGELQRWFASRPYGYRDLGPTEAQLMSDREAEYERLSGQLVRLTEAEERRRYEETTVGMRDEDGTQWTIAELRAAFDRWHPGDDWKRPVDVLIPAGAADLVAFCRAVEFFQGDRPKACAFKPHALGNALLRVTSRGYQG